MLRLCLCHKLCGGTNVQQLENYLDDLLVKKAPYQLPKNVKESLVKIMPIMTLVGGVLLSISVFYLFQALVWVNSFFSAIGVMAGTSLGIGLMGWVALALAAVEAVLFFMAFGPLQMRKKSGWDMLLWVSLAYAAYSVVTFLYNFQIVSAIFSLVGDVLGLYLLFQVRSYYAVKVDPIKLGKK
jgi:hypothetical protein